MDLYPWICALYIDKNLRGNNFGSILIHRAKIDSKNGGFDSLYLSTDHLGYYEKFGFSYIGKGYHPWREEFRIYHCKL